MNNLVIFQICLSFSACLVSGDEVVKWNGHNLRGLTFDQVYDVIFESKMDPRVELMVQRPIRMGELRVGIPELPDTQGNTLIATWQFFSDISLQLSYFLLFS